MKEQEFKAKLSKIVCIPCEWYDEDDDNKCVYHDNYENCPMFNEVFEALIAAGIGDVSEWKHRAEVAEKESEEYRNSNRIVLRGIEIIKRNILRYCATDFPNILQQAEKELQEEKKE